MDAKTLLKLRPATTCFSFVNSGPLLVISFRFNRFTQQRKDYMMVETRPVGCGLFCFWVVLVVLVLFSTIRLFFPSFNDDLGTMHTASVLVEKSRGVL